MLEINLNGQKEMWMYDEIFISDTSPIFLLFLAMQAVMYIHL